MQGRLQRLSVRTAATLVVLLAVAAAAPALAETRIALVIGNGAYDARLGPLANPVTDANQVAAALRQAGFQVQVATNLDQKGMKRAIVAFGQRLSVAGRDSTGLFFYAGHGLQSRGANYLAPIGAAIDTESDIDIEAVAADTVMRQMEDSGVGTAIVILDACRNTPVMRASRSASRGLARMEAPTGSFVAYSTAPGQTATDGDGGSPFAKALVANLALPGQPIEVTFRNVRLAVSNATGGQQTPWDSSSLMKPFYFIPGMTTASPGSSRPGDASATELAFWNAVAQSNDIPQYRTYLAQYPTGAFASVAKARIASLSPKVASLTAAAPAGARPAARTAITNPDWVRKPTGDDVAQFYPDQAARLEISGNATIKCVVNVTGTLRECEVVSESPADLGFGDAALKMSRLFKMLPRTRNGEPVDGGVVRIPLMFRVPPPEPQSAPPSAG